MDLIVCFFGIRNKSRGLWGFFMLISPEHGIKITQNSKNTKDESFSVFQAFGCCVCYADGCFNANN